MPIGHALHRDQLDFVERGESGMFLPAAKLCMNAGQCKTKLSFLKAQSLKAEHG